MWVLGGQVSQPEATARPGDLNWDCDWGGGGGTMGHATGEVAFSAMVKIVDLYFEGNHWKTERKEMTWHDLYFKKSLQPL